MDLRRLTSSTLRRRGPIASCLFLLCLEPQAKVFAQELDTALQPRDEGRYTVMDEIDDPRERAAFVELYRETTPEKRHRLAEQFIANYPQSWLLSHAYEAASKSSIDLGSFDRAIKEAQQSLRLYPENPMLLVPLANVAAQEKLMPLAGQAAQDALRYLDEFGPPSGTRKQDWPRLQSQLKASAYFALGRIYASGYFSNSGLEKAASLHKSLDFLTTALGWNPEDGEIYYLRAIVEEASGRSQAAAEDYAESQRRDEGFRASADKGLHRIYSRLHTNGDNAGYMAFQAAMPRPVVRPPSVPDNAKQWPAGGYAGSSSCISCHRREYDSWRQTGMSRMLRPYKAENIMGDFQSKAGFRGDHGEVIRMGNDGRPFFELINKDAQAIRYHVDFTIGSKWQQGYVTKLPDGRLQVLPIEYNKIRGQWVNYWKVIDPPSSVRANISEFPKLLPATNYQLNCAVCHTSQLRAASTAEEDIMRASFEEPGVNCEMCHGPSKNHIVQMSNKEQAMGSPAHRTAAPVGLLANTNRQEVQVCAQCHRQSSVRQASVRNELNYSSKGLTFLLPAVSRNYPEFLRRAFYKDGRFRETTFIVEAFTRSACFRRGDARCSSCHDPHPIDAESNPVSLKFLDDPDRRCLQCHSQFKANPEGHTHHAANSPGARCEACHMPRIMNSVLFQAGSHQIDDIPDPGFTARFGQKDSPNACLLCHVEKDAAWVSDKLAHW